MIDWDAEADALAEGYWQSADGVLDRFSMLAEDVQLATFNGAVKIVATSFGVTDFIIRGDLRPSSCEWCINHIGAIYHRGWFMPVLPRHPGCPHFYDILRIGEPLNV